MEQTKRKKTFKESMQATGRKVKSYAKKQTDKAKAMVKRYRLELRSAYDVGYASGWDNAYALPKRIGAKTSAAKGFKRGLSERKKADKYVQIRTTISSRR